MKAILTFTDGGEGTFSTRMDFIDGVDAPTPPNRYSSAHCAANEVRIFLDYVFNRKESVLIPGVAGGSAVLTIHDSGVNEFTASAEYCDHGERVKCQPNRLLSHRLGIMAMRKLNALGTDTGDEIVVPIDVLNVELEQYTEWPTAKKNEH